jgi:hypothetical protein
MNLKENLKAKTKLDELLQKLSATIKVPPGQAWLDKPLAREFLGMTDFERRKVRTLDLYVRPLKGEIMEVLVFDDELPVFHTTVADVALRKSSYWQEYFDIGNIKKIMFDKDVVVSKGKESLNTIHAHATALLDLTFSQDDLTLAVDDARQALELKSITRMWESFDLFFQLLNFRPIPLETQEHDFEIFARQKSNGSGISIFEHIIFFDEEKMSLGMKKGSFSPENIFDLAWINRYAGKEESVDLQGLSVFEFLSELAWKERKL